LKWSSAARGSHNSKTEAKGHHHSGWWFCREVNIVHRFDWYDAVIFAPVRDLEIHLLMSYNMDVIYKKCAA
jgi:hypothetical protein